MNSGVTDDDDDSDDDGVTLCIAERSPPSVVELIPGADPQSQISYPPFVLKIAKSPPN